MPSLTLYFIIQPPEYLYMACHLAASIRTHLPPEVELIGYCPASQFDEMGEAPLEVLRRLRCKVERLETDGYFDPAYPHGNKIIATLAPKTTDYAAFLDSDMAFLRPCTIEELIAEGQIGMVPSTSMRWADQSVWDDIYGVFGMPVPEERITMTRDQREDVVSYFNAGLLVIDERYRTADGRRFAEVWMETAQELDRHAHIPEKRPYLDQMTMPVATLRAGMTWNILPERYNYSIGGILRGQELPQDADVTLLHYRNRNVLGEAGRKKDLDQMLNAQIGTRLVRWVFEVPEEKALPLQYVPATQSEAPGGIAVPDPSKAAMAVLTIADGNPEMLARWIGYYGDILGRQSLYILNPGHDPQIASIAAGCNVIPVAADTPHGALWDAMASFASGLSLYFNWVTCLRPDEFLVADPIKAGDLGAYLSQMTAAGRIPRVTAPLGLVCVSPLDQGAVIAHVSDDAQKPCMSRGRIAYAGKGTACNVKSFAVDPHLCLIRLAPTDNQPEGTSIAPPTLDLPDLRAKLAASKAEGADGFWKMTAPDPAPLVRLPARYRDILLRLVRQKAAA